MNPPVREMAQKQVVKNDIKMGDTAEVIGNRSPILLTGYLRTSLSTFLSGLEAFSYLTLSIEECYTAHDRII